jgi:hypothetical protein
MPVVQIAQIAAWTTDCVKLLVRLWAGRMPRNAAWAIACTDGMFWDAASSS